MLPYINKIQKTRDFQTQFLGLNHTDNCADGEFYDMNNLSSDLYPILSTRGKDKSKTTPGSGTIKAMLMKEQMCIVKGENLIIGDNIVENFPISPVLDEAGKEMPITLVSMGAYLLIFPQNLYVNTKDVEDRGSMKEAFYADAPHTELYCYLSDQNGRKIFPNVEGEYPSTQYDAEQAGLSYYVDILGEEPRLMKKYTEGEAENWNVTNDCYVAIATTPSVEREGKDAMFDDRFPTDSVVLLSEFPDLPYDANLNGQKTVFKHLYEGDDEFTAQGDAILVQGVIASNFTAITFEIERVIPKMDHVVESNNRIWGCRYGRNEKGEQVNEIFSSALGDFKQWYKYGTESGSHFEGVGTDGPFTGAITYAGNPIFFKERFYHRVTGYSPSDFHVQTSMMPGVQNGAHKSLAIANNLLFYKGVDGIYVYDGTTPEMISKKLGDIEYQAVAACGHKNKYYVSLKPVDTNIAKSGTFVFDTKVGLWHKYNMPVKHFESDGEKLWYASGPSLIYLSNEDFSSSWYAETGVIGRETPDKKYITKLNIRASIKQFSRVIFYIEYDSNGRWLPVGILEGRTLQSFSLPIKLYRCDHFRIRMEGTGPVKIHSMSKTMIEGSDE